MDSWNVIEIEYLRKLQMFKENSSSSLASQLSRMPIFPRMETTKIIPYLCRLQKEGQRGII